MLPCAALKFLIRSHNTKIEKRPKGTFGPYQSSCGRGTVVLMTFLIHILKPVHGKNIYTLFKSAIILLVKTRCLILHQETTQEDCKIDPQAYLNRENMHINKSDDDDMHVSTLFKQMFVFIKCMLYKGLKTAVSDFICMLT